MRKNWNGKSLHNGTTVAVNTFSVHARVTTTVTDNGRFKTLNMTHFKDRLNQLGNCSFALSIYIFSTYKNLCVECRQPGPAAFTHANKETNPHKKRKTFFKTGPRLKPTKQMLAGCFSSLLAQTHPGSRSMAALRLKLVFFNLSKTSGLSGGSLRELLFNVQRFGMKDMRQNCSFEISPRCKTQKQSQAALGRCADVCGVGISTVWGHWSNVQKQCTREGLHGGKTVFIPSKADHFHSALHPNVFPFLVSWFQRKGNVIFGIHCRV